MSQANGHMEKQVDAQTTQTEQRTGLDMAGSQASRKGFDPQELLSTDFLTTLTDPDVDRSYPDDDSAQHNIEELMAAEFSQQLQLGQITREEYKTEKEMDKARALLAMCQFSEPHGVGSKCQGDTRNRMLGGHSGAKDVEDFRKGSDDLRQQIRTSYEQRSQMRSGSINGRTLRGFFESVAVARSEGFDFDAGGRDGWLSKLSGGLVG